ncbi:hypothetical protein QJS04_geneDACA023450 [Acorus gramineus]|uniref:Aminotransferase-like plant mobile domain-containing protein n=1 Tax=Acorus gramineus TaxID=55184 RepID=A0AAV9A453_ACOGR|nr:hypothetical protein QJS04_geneDACA023450 [Acorus gramineus]
MQLANPGSVFNSKTHEDDDPKFQRVFWAFGPSIAGFRHCHPVLSIDGTHFVLKGARGLPITSLIQQTFYQTMAEDPRRAWHGPLHDGLLYYQKHHRFVAVIEREKWIRDVRLIPFLGDVGLYHLTKVAWIRLDRVLITALVERWWPKTCTFHLRNGEMTITLQDVSILLGLLIEDRAVTGRFEDPGHLCQQLLGRIPPNNQMRGGAIEMGWLRQQFMVVPRRASGGMFLELPWRIRFDASICIGRSWIEKRRHK